MRRREFSIGRVLLIYALGLAAGIQCALYLYDTFDDGVSDPLSGAIGIAFLILGLGLVVWSFQRPRT